MDKAYSQVISCLRDLKLEEYQEVLDVRKNNFYILYENINYLFIN